MPPALFALVILGLDLAFLSRPAWTSILFQSSCHCSDESKTCPGFSHWDGGSGTFSSRLSSNLIPSISASQVAGSFSRSWLLGAPSSGLDLLNPQPVPTLSTQVQVPVWGQEGEAEESSSGVSKAGLIPPFSGWVLATPTQP
jgi:hypothetical protein